MAACPTYQAFLTAKAALERAHRSLTLDNRTFLTKLGLARQLWPLASEQPERDAYCAKALAAVHAAQKLVDEAHVVALRALAAVEDQSLVANEVI